jgi:hypothetical protein
MYLPFFKMICWLSLAAKNRNSLNCSKMIALILLVYLCVNLVAAQCDDLLFDDCIKASCAGGLCEWQPSNDSVLNTDLFIDRIFVVIVRVYSIISYG